MDNVHVMAALRQGVRQPVQLHGIAAKAVRRVERGQVQKIQGTAHSNYPLTRRRRLEKAPSPDTLLPFAFCVLPSLYEAAPEPRAMAVAAWDPAALARPVT